MTIAPVASEHLTGREVFPTEHTPISAAMWHHDGDDVIHDHTFMEIAIVFAGSAIHRTVYGDQPIDRGEVIVLNPGAWHAYVGCRGLALFNCCFGIELLQRELAWTKEDSLLNYLLWSGPSAQERRGIMRFGLPEQAMDPCRGLLEALEHSTRPEAGDNRAQQIGCLLMFLAELVRHLGPEHHSIARRAPAVHPAVAEGMHLLEEDLGEAWTLPELARRLHVDPSYLVRLFKAGTGLPPMAYLARARAEHAAVMLLRTERPIADIAAEVGWDDPNYFARRFKAHFGLSASAYRRQYGSTADSVKQ